MKILKLVDADPDPASGILSTLDPGSEVRDGNNRIRDNHPGSATLNYETMQNKTKPNFRDKFLATQNKYVLV
jgi:hypothetical protein